MNKRTIDLSDIKENDLDKTSSFTDLMSRSEKKQRQLEKEQEKKLNNADDIIDMIKEKKKNEKDLIVESKSKNKNVDQHINDDEKEKNLGKTQILELTRQMKFNIEEVKLENNKKKKKGISVLNIIGEINLLCIGYYIYLLIFTNYQEDQRSYLLSGLLIVLLVLMFGLSVITNKKISKFFNILNIIIILSFLILNTYTLIH